MGIIIKEWFIAGTTSSGEKVSLKVNHKQFKKLEKISYERKIPIFDLAMEYCERSLK